MRIGINASFLRKPGTGIGQVTVHCLQKLTESGESERDEFFLYSETEPEISFDVPNNFRMRSFLPRFWKRDDVVRKILWEKMLASKAQEDGCDVFLSLYQSSTIIPKPIRHVMVVHDIIPKIFPEYVGNIRQWWYWKQVERGMRAATALVAISETTKNDLVEFGLARESIVVAYPDAGPLFSVLPSQEEQKHVLEKYGLKRGYIYHGGGLEIRKNTERLLQAYRLLVQKETDGLLSSPLPPLVISGKIFSPKNPLATPIRKLLLELGLTERVHLLDFVPEEDLPALYRGALFFVFPSLYEGFGLPVVEALRMGTPILASDASSLSEVAGDAALFINPQSVESIASGIERLLDDGSLRKQLTDAAPNECARFSWERFIRTLLLVLKKTETV